MAFALKRRLRAGAMISVVSLIDVLMILLIFFMVTSTYLDLDMVPAVAPAPAVPDLPAQDPPAQNGAAPPGPGGGAAPAPVLLLRIGSDDAVQVRGQRLELAALADWLAAELAGQPGRPVALFPSPGASMQALVTAMDAASAAGVRQLRVIRLEAPP